MKIVLLSQTNDREAWLDMRRGKIGGSDAKGVKPLTRGTDRTPAGFWDLLAQKLSIAKDGEPERDRGQRLENEGLALTAAAMGVELDLDPGMWLSDVDLDISVSPDAAEPGDAPTYAAENKCLDSKYHLKAIARDKKAKLLPDYSPIDSLVIDSKHDFSYQVIQYFAVNENLQTVYFGLYDDRIVVESLMHYVITITREDVADEIAQQVVNELEVLSDVRELTQWLIAN